MAKGATSVPEGASTTPIKPARRSSNRPVNPPKAASTVLAAVLAGAVAACLALFGCAQGPSYPDDILLTSTHFRYHARADDPPCPGLLDVLEANVATVSAFLRLDPARIDVEYYKYRDADDARASSPCPNDWHSCTGGTVIHTGARQAFQHELIHAYVAHLGEPNNVFQEGLAEIFNCESMAGPADPRVSWQDLATVAEHPNSAQPDLIGRGAYYAASAFLVRHLLDRFGVERLMRFYAGESTNRGSMEQFRMELEAAFGVPIDELWADAFAESTAFGYPYLCLCERSERLGAVTPFDASCATGIPQTFAYDVDGTIPVSLVFDGAGAFALLRSCDGKAPSPALQMDTSDYIFQSEQRSGFALVSELSAGRFFVSAMAGVGSFTFGPTPWLGPGCESVSPLRMGVDLPADYKLWVSIPHLAERWLRLELPAPFTQAYAGMLDYCGACPPVAGATCRSPQTTAEVIPPGEYTIRVGPGTGPRYHQVGVQYSPSP